LPSPRLDPSVCGFARLTGSLGRSRPAVWLSRGTGEFPGLLHGASIALVAVVTAVPEGLGPALAGLLTAAAGMTLAAACLGAGAECLRLERRRGGRWNTPLLIGFVTALVAEAAFAVAGGSGAAAAVLLFLAAAAWAGSLALLTDEDRRSFFAVPAITLLSLLLIVLLGHTVGAGLLYYLGPPLAFAVVLTAHYVVGQRRRKGVFEAGPALAGYVIASAVIAFLAWVDLN